MKTKQQEIRSVSQDAMSELRLRMNELRLHIARAMKRGDREVVASLRRELNLWYKIRQ